MTVKSTGRRGRPPLGQESKLQAVLNFMDHPPKNWDSLTSRERKDKVSKALGINPPYLQQLITKNEELKDFFGIIRRRRRTTSRLGYSDVVRAVRGLELSDLVNLHKDVRVEIKRRIEEAKAEVNASL